MARRRKYLNNRDILIQIHLSKMTYCAFRDSAIDNQQDIIFEDISEINKQTIQEGIEARAKRLSKLTEEKIKPDDIDKLDVVFRIMTTEHIPLVPKKKVKVKAVPVIRNVIEDLDFEYQDLTEVIENHDADIEMVPMRTNFHPFFHYRVDSNNTPYLVGKSHWKGTLEVGEFNQTFGRTSNELAKMYMKLCDRYGTRSNWRGYTYNDEMRGAALVQLSQVGLKFNELKSDNPFAYYTAIVTNSFTRVLLNEKKMQNIRDDILEENGLAPSWTRQQTHSDVKETERSRRMYKSHSQRYREANTAKAEEERQQAKEQAKQQAEE
jgi:hypothetical protein